MTRYVVEPALVLSLGIFSTAFATEAVFPDAPAQLLPGDRVLLGTVEEVAGEQARIDTGEVQPRYIPMKVRQGALRPQEGGSRRDYGQRSKSAGRRPYVGESSHHHVVPGRTIEPLATGHQKAVIRNSRSGKEESHFIRPVARSKVASVPVGIEAVFLIDELNKVVDVTFGSPEAIHQAAERWQKQTPLKGHREN
jgi:hypothetical protein